MEESNELQVVKAKAYDSLVELNMLHNWIAHVANILDISQEGLSLTTIESKIKELISK